MVTMEYTREIESLRSEVRRLKRMLLSLGLVGVSLVILGQAGEGPKEVRASVIRAESICVGDPGGGYRDVYIGAKGGAGIVQVFGKRANVSLDGGSSGETVSDTGLRIVDSGGRCRARLAVTGHPDSPALLEILGTSDVDSGFLPPRAVLAVTGNKATLMMYTEDGARSFVAPGAK